MLAIWAVAATGRVVEQAPAQPVRLNLYDADRITCGTGCIAISTFE